MPTKAMLEQENARLRRRIAKLEKQQTQVERTAPLFESSERFNALFQTMSQGVVYQDDAGVIILSNPAAERILGLSSDQLQGRTSVDPRWRAVRADGSDFPGQEHPSMVALRTSKAVNDVVMGIYHPAQDETRWILVSAQPEFRAGETLPYRVFTTFTDITARQRAEEASQRARAELETRVQEQTAELTRANAALQTSQTMLQGFYDSAPFMMGIAELDGNKTVAVSANRATENFLSIRPEDLPGKSGTELGNPEDFERLWVENYQRCQQQGVPAQFEYEYPHVSGTRWLEAHIAYLGIGSSGLAQFSFVALDVTARKRTEHALRQLNETLEQRVAERTAELAQSEQKFRELADSITDVFFAFDQTLHYTYWNKASEILTGVPAQHAIGKAFSEMFPDTPALKDAEQNYRQAIESKQPRFFTSEYEIQGVRYYFDVNVYPTAHGISVIAKDVTAARQAEQQLRESETKFSTVFRNIPLSLRLTDTDGRYLDVNKATVDLFGYSVQETVGKTANELGIINEADNQKVGVLLGKQDGVINNLELQVQIKNGETRDILFSITPIMLNGMRHHLGAAVDITQRKYAERALRVSEEKYSVLFRQAAIPAMLVQLPENVIVDVNDAFEKEFGYARADIIGSNSAQINLMSADERVRLFQALAQGKLAQGDVAQLTTKSGKLVIAQIKANTVEFGGRRYAIGTIHDITDRMRAEEQLQALSRRLVEMQENERRVLARELHDEVGQALTAIKMSLLATRLETNPAINQQRLSDSIGIVERTLSQVRDLSLDLRPSLLDDFGLVSALEWYLKREAERTHTTIELIADTNIMRLPMQLETTCFRIVQSAMTNVARHAHAQHVQITLHKHDPNQLQVDIADDGVGFDVAHALAQARRGNSLGLLAMQERTQLVGGTIEFISAPMQGTRVRAIFPINE